MAPKNSKPNKINNQFNSLKIGECIKEIYQANSLENIIRKYNSLNNPSITLENLTTPSHVKYSFTPLKI